VNICVIHRTPNPGSAVAGATVHGPATRTVAGLVPVAVWLVVAVTALVLGAPYYLASPAERAFSDLHDLYAPTGVVGHSLGYVGTLMIAAGVAGYMVRKRVLAFRRLGRLSAWLRWHIFLCTLGPFLVLLHTAFKVGGIVSIAFWAMVLVVASGVLGRYVYTRLPRRLDGGVQSLEAVRARQEALKTAIAARTGLPPEKLASLFPRRGRASERAIGALRIALSHDLSARRRAREARRVLARHGVSKAAAAPVLALLRQESTTELQLRLLLPFQRLFRHWHTFHLPLAIVMLLIVIVHVAVAWVFGYGWPL
jgi:hypothetical protein